MRQSYMRINALTLFFGILLKGAGVCYAQTAPAKVDVALKTQRDKIDSLDNQLLKILGAREQIVKEVGIYKAKNNIPSLQPARFQQILEANIATGKKMGLSAEFITELMNAIHKESLRIEDEIKTH